MAEEEVKKEAKPEKPKKKGFNFKIILIGLPLFIVQLVLVYFITATFLIKSAPGTNAEADGEHVEKSEDDEHEESEGAPQHIFSVNDLIINPAGTNGQRLLLLSVGFGVSTEESKKVLEENEIVIKDKILSAMSKKSLSLLSKVEMKDSLKVEIADKINLALPDAKIKNVYFSKYVLN